jgi:hypothetical protein
VLTLVEQQGRGVAYVLPYPGQSHCFAQH